MTKYFSNSVFLAIVLSVVFLAHSGVPRALGEENSTSESKWVTLFDGSDMEHWRGYQQEEVPDDWSIDDGALHTQAGKTDIISREKFSDFELEFTWKISEGGNSGVMIRVSEDQPRSYHTGPEFQLLDNKSHDVKPTASTATGALYALYSPEVGAARPVGEWNHARIVIRGGHLEHWLNGVKLLECEIGSDDWKERVANSKFAAWPAFATHSSGHIALQGHDHPVWFRDIRIREIRGSE